ncbi:MAG TPA: AgmX/PglI C-terminal domain-containing protein [Anaeromyxobacter sp.]|nr:AgmX/PglI C-terminal domain-containing protein [Anaeromyxobacter sp.]
MAYSLDESELPDDAALEGGEWLYRRGGEVFGPVSSRELAGELYRGALDAGTPVSPDGGRWVPVGEVPIFRVHARKAEAALRVEREITGARLLVRRRRRRGTALLLSVSLGAVVLAAVAAYLLSPRHSRVSPLLEDFGEGLRVASARVAAPSGRRARELEVEVPLSLGPSPGPTLAEKAPRPASRAASAEEGEGLVAAHFDAGRIQAIVNREQRTLAPCFREEAARSSDFRGLVPLEFAIGNDGRVVALWIDEPRFREGPLRECLLRSLATWRFDPFPGERPTVQLAFTISR